jgi:hypothetical protein
MSSAIEEVSFGVVAIDPRLTCSKRLIDDCSKAAENFMKSSNFVTDCWVAESDTLQDGSIVLNAKIRFEYLEEINDLIARCRAYCHGIRDGILGVLGREYR